MRLRLLAASVVASLAVGVGVVAPAQPARAALGGWFDIIINAVVTIANRSGNGSGGDPQLEAAKREIIAAVENAKQEILNHIDAIASAEVEACTNAAVTKFAQIDSMPGSLLGPFVNGAVDCAALSNSYFNAVQDPAAADNIGKLMGVIYSIAMAGFTKYGLSTTGLLAGLISGYEAVVVKLKPNNCDVRSQFDPEIMPRPKRGDLIGWDMWCWAYNGDFGGYAVDLPFPSTPTDAHLDVARREAGKNISYGTALRALPPLRAVRG